MEEDWNFRMVEQIVPAPMFCMAAMNERLDPLWPLYSEIPQLVVDLSAGNVSLKKGDSFSL